ncbi:MAG: cytochrome c [Saprospiraceae bacterium]
MLKTWITILFLSLIWIAGRTVDEEIWTSQTKLQEVQQSLGEKRPEHFMPYNHDLSRMGEELVKKGRTEGPDGKRTRYISKHYVCTTCHNLEIEDPDIRISNPEARLDYVKKHKLPFLQGTTFKGIVNRESWYNDDYVKKYGDEKIEIAHKDLRESIQLCAIECSQGRPMKDWEIDAVLTYYWDLQYTLDDLRMTSDDLQKLNKEKQDQNNYSTLKQWLRSLYNTTSPAHFYDAPADKESGYENLVGDPEKGKDLYELSCLHCHHSEGVSHYVLDNSKVSFRHLEKMITKDSHFSLYQIIAYGTYAIPGHRPYMPHYPAERMSKQQVEDLRAYIELAAK